VSDGPVTVGRYEWEMLARLAASRLAAAGIRSWIPESSMGSICWHYTKALGGIRLQVSPEDAEDARAILDERPSDAGEPISRGTGAVAERAARAAAFGCVAATPLTFYAGWLLIRLVTSAEALDAAARRNALLAAILVLPLLLAVLAVWRALQ
jgi:hypothetical protein